MVAVQPQRNSCRCPECGRRGKIVQVMEFRRWRDVRVGGRTVWLHHAPREIRCPTHGRRLEEAPWAARSAQVSYRFEYLLLRYCQWMTQAAAARLLGLAPSTLSDQLHRLIARRRTGHRIRGLTTLGIDANPHGKRCGRQAGSISAGRAERGGILLSETAGSVQKCRRRQRERPSSKRGLR